MSQYILKWDVLLGLFAWLLWSGEIPFESFQQLAQQKSYPGQLAFARLFELYRVAEPAFGGNVSTLHITVWGVFTLLGALLFAVSKGTERSESPAS